jgi:hypothetical protein
VEAGKTGCNPKTDPGCYAWLTFCAGSASVKYSQPCMTDAECVTKVLPGVDLHVACFKKQGPTKAGTCEIRAFYNGSVSQCNGGAPDPQQAAPASKVACNNTYGSINPLDPNPSTRIDYADQPPVAKCSEVTFGGKQVACIGDDTLHSVLHGAYTWPNDPEVFPGDAPVYRIVFSPEGQGNAPITAAGGLPDCAKLPDNYKPADNRFNCRISIDNQNAVFGIARVRNQPPNQWQSSGNDWPCDLVQRGAGDNGVVCYWNPPAADSNCTAPKTDDTYVTDSACGRIDSGTKLVSGSITPNSSDPLFLEVSIPKVLNNVSKPVSVSGCVPATGMGAWTLVASQAVLTNQGIIAWYKGTANTSLSCNVTVTMAAENPAELKVYDVPKFNGTVDKMSTAAGSYTSGAFVPVNAGSATTVWASDLQLGAMLLVNQSPTPITYWTRWLTNGAGAKIDCLTVAAPNTNCPKDDGTDYLPGHGPFSGNSDVGHNVVKPGAQYFHRDSEAIPGQSKFAWAGLAIYIELKP